MIKFLGSLFGFKRSSGKRKVIGNIGSYDIKEAEIVNNSNSRLTNLNYLAIRYKGTAQEHKIKSVYDKTRNIHNYLLSKSKIHELEIFHLQNTDHFINTFTVIMDNFQRNKEGNFNFAYKKPGNETYIGTILADRRKVVHSSKLPELVRPLRSQGNIQIETLPTEAPKLTVPEISIDTYSQIVYFREGTTSALIENEIGFTSTNEEKEAFINNVSTRMGVKPDGMSYVGNAIVNIPNHSGTFPTGYVPVIHWKGFLYAINLNDYRLFPVKMHRNRKKG
ncbi:hypothetical protein BH23BAC1_BH23BAC1_41160 [soil metagenome]